MQWPSGLIKSVAVIGKKLSKKIENVIKRRSVYDLRLESISSTKSINYYHKSIDIHKETCYNSTIN